MTWSKMRLNVKERGPIIQIDPNVTQHQKSKREMNLINFDDQEHSKVLILEKDANWMVIA